MSGEESFVVVFEGQHFEAFGPFDSFEGAYNWMREDVEHCLKELDAASFESCRISPRECEVSDYGHWEIVPLQRPAK